MFTDLDIRPMEKEVYAKDPLIDTLPIRPNPAATTTTSQTIQIKVPMLIPTTVLITIIQVPCLLTDWRNLIIPMESRLGTWIRTVRRRTWRKRKRKRRKKSLNYLRTCQQFKVNLFISLDLYIVQCVCDFHVSDVAGCRSVEEFQCLNRIEEGTYGVVYRARDKRTDEIVALKRLKMEKEKEGFPITSLREINTLLKAQHPNIVTVREIVVGSNMDKIFIVMDYVEHDLKSLMETMKQKKQVFIPGNYD